MLYSNHKMGCANWIPGIAALIYLIGSAILIIINYPIIVFILIILWLFIRDNGETSKRTKPESKIEKLQPPPKVTKNFESLNNSYSDDFIYWNNDKNYVVGYVHAGYIEIVDINSCRIVSLVENEYTLFTKYIGLQAYKSDYKKSQLPTSEDAGLSVP